MRRSTLAQGTDDGETISVAGSLPAARRSSRLTVPAFGDRDQAEHASVECGRAYPQPVRTLRRWRWMLVVAAVVALVAIWLLGPKYTQLQLASDAEAFRRIVGDDRSRYIGAGGADVAFAAVYGLLALAIARTPLASRIGAWLVLMGAAFDEAENSLLIANVLSAVKLSDGRVELMRTFGVAKYLAIAAGVLVYGGSLIIERLRRRSEPRSNG